MPDNNLPDWAHWQAQDADGTWWAYEVEPLQHFTGWYENEVGQCVRMVKGKANPQWQSTLMKIDTGLNRAKN
jgi:hypothetical protein